MGRVFFNQRTKDLIESAGCRIIFLPLYSPDLNPIEKFWANNEAMDLNSEIENFAYLSDSIDFFFQIRYISFVYYNILNCQEVPFL